MQIQQGADVEASNDVTHVRIFYAISSLQLYLIQDLPILMCMCIILLVYMCMSYEPVASPFHVSTPVGKSLVCGTGVSIILCYYLRV